MCECRDREEEIEDEEKKKGEIGTRRKWMKSRRVNEWFAEYLHTVCVSEWVYIRIGLMWIASVVALGVILLLHYSHWTTFTQSNVCIVQELKKTNYSGADQVIE